MATHNCHETYGYLPPLSAPDGWTNTTVASPPFNGKKYTVFNWLLPFVEQDAIYKAQGDTVPTPSGGPGYCGGQYMRPIKTYVCPSDPSHIDGMCATTNGTANLFAGSSYGANYYVFGNPSGTGGDTTNVQGRSTIPASIPDGLSNTVFFAEVYVTCGSTGNIGSLNASLWADSTRPWRPVICHNNSGKSASAGYAPCYMFQVQPNFINSCDPARAQSPHAGGINVCLGDGSVRFVAASISATTWGNACDPRESTPLGGDW